MASVTSRAAAGYAIDVLGYCFGLFVLAAIPSATAVLVVEAGGGASGIVSAGLALLSVVILLAGVAGLLYKAVADGVALAHGNGDERADETRG